MVLSMTGYGRAGALLHGRDIKVELRSVNARFFEYSSRLPRSCAFLDDRLKKLVAAKVSRGKVELSLTIQTVTAADTVVSVNWQLAEGYRAALNAMAERMDLKNDVSVGMLSRFPDVLTQTAAPTNEDELWEDVCAVAEQAVDAFIAMRAARHGAHDEEPRSDDHHPRQQVDQNRGPVVGLVFIDHRNGLPRLLLGGLQILAKRIYRTDGESQLHARLGQAAETLVHRVVTVLLAGLLFQEHLRLVAVHDLDLLHVALLNHLLHGGPVAGQRRFIAAVEQIPADDEQTDQAVDPQHRGPRHVHIHFIVVLAFLCHNPDYSSYSYFTSGASAHSSSSL